MTARVINRHHGEPFDVYIGRPSCWGNPFYAGVTMFAGGTRVASRVEAVTRYEAWILQQPQLLARLGELRGKVLGCWCKPFICHGDVLVRLANPTEARDLSALMNALLDPEAG